MGMSTYVVGIKPPDDKWKKMKSIWDACKAGGVVPPFDVEMFFGSEPPDDKGVLVDIGPSPDGCVREWHTDMHAGFEVHVDKLPKDVKIIRFYNSW